MLLPFDELRRPHAAFVAATGIEFAPLHRPDRPEGPLDDRG